MVPIPLFFGADFLFGSVFVLLVLSFFGFRWGMLAAVIAHSYTYFLWGHPYGFVNFVGEALFVGLLLKKGRRNLLGLVGLFWLTIGMPLVWIEHGVIMHMGAITTAFIMLKQGINGIFNAVDPLFEHDECRGDGPHMHDYAMFDPHQGHADG